MSKQRKDINLCGNRLNPKAVKLANQELLKNNPQLFDYTNRKMRKLTMEWSDTMYRKEWMDAYLKYAKIEAKRPVSSSVPDGMLVSDLAWSKVEVSIKIRWWSTPKKFNFIRAVSEVEKCYECLDIGIETHKKINSDQWFVSYFS